MKHKGLVCSDKILVVSHFGNVMFHALWDALVFVILPI